MAKSKANRSREQKAERRRGKSAVEEADCAVEEEGESAPEPSIKLPSGQRISLPGRGEIFYRDVAGPEDAPVVLLLHGWFASGGLNWGQAFESLSAHFRVIAPDQRGHGRGIRGWRGFQLEDCADDAAALLEALEIPSAIVVGYSMGGPVGQLLWRRHPARVSGLVMCATSGEPVSAGPVGRVAMSSVLSLVAGTARLGQLATRVPWAIAETLAKPLEREEPTLDVRFAIGEMGRHDLRMLLEAGVALSRYQANDWIREIDVPMSVVVTTEDRTVIPEGQMRQALEVRNVRIYCVDDGHAAVTDPGFAEQLRLACLDVAERAASERSPALRARRRQQVEHTVEALLGHSQA